MKIEEKKDVVYGILDNLRRSSELTSDEKNTLKEVIIQENLACKEKGSVPAENFYLLIEIFSYLSVYSYNEEIRESFTDILEMCLK